MENKYHVFKAYNYKGGELSCRTNLTLEQAIDEVYEYWLEDVDFLDITDDEHRELTDSEILTSLGDYYEGSYDTYAGYSGCSLPKVFITTEDGLESYEFRDEDLISWGRKDLAKNKYYKEFLSNE